MPKLDNQTIQLALFALIALAMLTQAIVLLVAFVSMRKAAKGIREQIDDLRFSILPVIENARDLFTRLAPKVEQTTDDLAALTRALRVQTADVQSAATEIVARARRQASRLDTMLSNVLDAIDRANAFMTDAIAKPVRQFSAVLASAKAVVESLRNSEPASRAKSNHAPGDNDMFV